MSDNTKQLPGKRRVHHFAQMKQTGEKITVITAYDYPTAVAASSADPDAILVGDSLGMVALGFESTIPVTMEIMLHHTAAVNRGNKNAFLIADMPFLSYHQNIETSIINAGQLIQLAGAEAVKLEGGAEVYDDIKAIVRAGIPVMAHIGLLPQSVHQLGGYRVQGKNDASAAKLIEDALSAQEAGAFAIVVEATQAELAAEITSRLQIPTIGIGAGRQCDGQVLVLTDIIGMLPGKAMRFVKRYAQVSELMEDAVRKYCDDVKAGRFPEESNEYR